MLEIIESKMHIWVVAIGLKSIQSIEHIRHHGFADDVVAEFIAIDRDTESLLRCRTKNRWKLEVRDISENREVIEDVFRGSSIVFIVTSEEESYNLAIASEVGLLARNSVALVIGVIITRPSSIKQLRENHCGSGINSLLEIMTLIPIVDFRNAKSNKVSKQLPEQLDCLLHRAIACIAESTYTDLYPICCGLSFGDLLYVFAAPRIAFLSCASSSSSDFIHEAIDAALANVNINIAKAEHLWFAVTSSRTLEHYELEEMSMKISALTQNDFMINQRTNESQAEIIQITLLAVFSNAL